MCGARLFAVRVILLQRYKVLPACLPDFGSLPMLTQGSCNGRQEVQRKCPFGRWLQKSRHPGW